MNIVTAQQMKALDQQTINDIGIPGIVLMENAGRGTVEQIQRYFPDVLAKRIVVLCGRGNNGGDGFVIARYLYNAGCNVKTFLLAPIDKVGGDAKINMIVFQNMGALIQEITDEKQWQHALTDVKHAGLVIDALLGTGLSSEVRGLYRSVIKDVNEATSVPVVSVDIPSGVDATTGRILGAAIHAQLTCTFGLPKRGHVVFPGLAHTGTLEIVDIGIPNRLINQAGITEYLLDENYFTGSIPRRDPEAHKGTYGHVCILAGSPGKTGAAAMAGQAAMRTGAGLVTLGVPESLNPILEAKVTEVMTEPIADKGKGVLDSDEWSSIRDLLAGKTVVALGPGLSDQDTTAQLVYRVIESSPIPIVIDADGLNVLAKKPTALQQAQAPVIITPHPGEMARLMGTTVQSIQSDRISCARDFSRDYGAVVVLKGARTIIAEPNGRIYINPTGNPGLASAGMGDVLTGIIAGLTAQGLTPLRASQLGVFIHGSVGDTLAGEGAPIGIMATDLINRIPAALSSFIE